MASFALIDYCHLKKGYANRDQTGGYGSMMHATGLLGYIITRLKSNMLHLPVMSFGYIASILRKTNHQVKFYSGMPLGEDYIIIASSITQYLDEIELARRIKEKFPLSKVGFINTFSSVMPDIFKDVSDFIIIGEPEWAILEFTRGNLELRGQIEICQKGLLDDLGYPDWEGFPYKSFSYFPSLPKRPFFPVLSSRGCPYNCGFCPYVAGQGYKWRTRSIDSVISEIKYLREKYNTRSILFRDPIFTMKMERAAEIAERIMKDVSGIEWSCETRLDKLTPDLIDLMYKSGLRSINIGIESYDNEILKRAGKKTIVHEHQEKVIRHMNRLGIRVAGFYIIGLLDDTKESIARTIDYSKKLNTFAAQFCILTPFPGTKLYSEVEDRLLTKDFSKYTEYDPVVKIDNITPYEIIQLKNQAYSSYYFRLDWILQHTFQTIKCVLNWL